MEKDKSLEEVLKELDVLVSKLEEGDVELEESIKIYEKCSGLISFSEKTLKESKLRLDKIKDSTGKIVEDNSF